jgi:eukaryotic-like serine/threonine-protein kinase
MILSSTTPMALQIGDQFDRYQIRGYIAQGGMSSIYRAFDLMTGKEVVLKVPDGMMIGDPAQYERFQRELEVMRTLNHPAIQKGLASGRYNNTPFLVTELVTGESMRELIQRRGPFPPDEAIILLKKIAEGVAHCHDNGIIHRDLKPENILINSEGQPIILDFGLALTKGAHRVTYANLSGAAGTPDYMAPEQVEGHRGDQRTDLYSLGIMLYELLKGQAPFSGDSNLAVMAQHVRSVVPRLDKEVAGVTSQLASIVARCLRKNPDKRYEDLHELIWDLDHLETVNLAVLDEVDGESLSGSIPKLSFLKPVGVALLILLGMIILALILQKLH